MSRSFGATPLTTRSPIAIRPPEISSSPAIIRKSVDLPQPEGPTSTQNSPSSTPMSTPCTTSVEPKLLRTPERVTDAMRVLDLPVRPCAVIHLAALQVPFCKADPVAGAKVNVVGTVNVFEAARRLGIGRIAYASSIAAYGAMDDGHGAMHTLYGAYKYCDEQIAKVYSEDWNVASVGIRPGVVYGVGRDQGLTSKTTFAILAAAAGKPYEVPFSGGVSWLYAGEVASAFIHAVSRERTGAPVFDLTGVYAPVEEGLRILKKLAPSAAITASGQPLAFPMHLPDKPLRDFLGDYGEMPLAEGIRETYEAFRSLIRRGMLSMPEAA